MRRVNKRDILMLIILLILLIIMIRAFIGSRANNVLEVTVNFKDDKNLLGSETITMEAVNEGESGIAITLPSIVNTKYISKYIITEKDIMGNENKLTVDLMPGEKIYLTQEEVESLEVNLIVEYDTVEKDSQILYNKQLILKDEEEYELLSVSGYMPNDTQMEVQETDITSIENEILQKYPNSFVIGNYDIKLISNEKEYIAKDYEQKLNIHISIIDENNIYNVLEIKDDKIEELNDIVIESNKIKFTVEELRKFLIIQESEASVFAGENTEDSTEENTEENTENSQIVQSGGTTTYAVDKENIKFEIDDFESDKNYYLGLNYTEGMSKTNLGKYTETNLKEVTINYYGNNYDIVETNVRENFDITLNASATRTTTGNTQQSGNGNNRTYTRTDIITCTISGITALKTQYSEIQADSGWTMQIPVPSNNFATYFYANGTNTANSSNGISVSVSNQIMTVSGEDSSRLEGNDDTWTFTFSVSLSGNNRNTINNINYTNLTVNSFATTISAIRLTSSATISNTELHDLIVYKKCVPINSNGNVEIELIDNPFMNRPIGQGFNGWKTNDTRYANSISTNTNTFVQTINTSINNITDDEGNYVINLYPDWVQANVIFVSSSGNSNNSGTSPSSPVNNNWDNINSKINSNIKNCTNASNREVNIVVLMNGTLDIDGLTEANTPITLTSLYNGTNYGSTSTYLNVDNANIQADSDLQLHHLYVSSSKSYTSPSGTTDGTSAVTPCLYGNMYNVRIGRGVVPTNSNYCTWAQVQGGYYNRSSSEYKLIIESGQYYTVQLYRASGGNTSTTANATIVIGSDIERVINNNSTLKIYNRMASRTTSATATPYQSGRLVNMIIKSGTIGVDYFNNASTADNSNRNYAGIYVGGHGDTGYDKGDRYLVVEGGNIANIIGGLSMDEDDMHKTYMRVKDGNIINITGGAGYTHTYGDRIIQVTGGCVKYSISGGSNGVAASTTTNNGQLTGESLIYVGGTAQIGASYSIDENGNRVITETNTSETLYGVNSGCVCGGANGNSDYAGQTDASYIIIDGQAIVHNNVYGGGNYGVIGSEDATPEGAEVIEINNQTSRFAANTEYFITTSATGGNTLSVSGTRLSNQTMSTAMVPSDSGKWIFESAGGNEYYLKNVTTGMYIYVESTEGSWRYTNCKFSFKCNRKNSVYCWRDKYKNNYIFIYI